LLDPSFVIGNKVSHSFVTHSLKIPLDFKTKYGRITRPEASNHQLGFDYLGAKSEKRSAWTKTESLLFCLFTHGNLTEFIALPFHSALKEPVGRRM
jgi:hypothetical protein